MNLLWILFISLLGSSSSLAARNISCRNWRSRMDRQASKLFMIGDRSLVVPTTVDQVSQEFCPRILDSIESIKAIARSCLKPFPKQLVGIMLQAIRKVNKEICSSKEEKETVIKHLSCVKDSNRLEQVHVLMDHFIMFTHSVQRNVTDQTKKIPFICCQYMNLLNDLESKISNWCDRDSIDYVLNMIRRMMTTVIATAPMFLTISVMVNSLPDEDPAAGLGVCKRNRRKPIAFVPRMVVKIVTVTPPKGFNYIDS